MYRTSHITLRAAYAAAQYWVDIDGRRLRIVPLTPWPATIPGLRGWCAQITACNPGSRAQSTLDNARAHDDLRAILARDGMNTWPAGSSDAQGDWHEPGFLVLDTRPEYIDALAHRFGQYAVLAGAADDVPRLRYYDDEANAEGGDD
jgi:hypothetical protein